jgi:hypothetical protein
LLALPKLVYVVIGPGYSISHRITYLAHLSRYRLHVCEINNSVSYIHDINHSLIKFDKLSALHHLMILTREVIKVLYWHRWHTMQHATKRPRTSLWNTVYRLVRATLLVFSILAGNNLFPDLRASYVFNSLCTTRGHRLGEGTPCILYECTRCSSFSALICHKQVSRWKHLFDM